MAHREVNLTKRIQTPNGLRYCPVAMSANGRVKPDAVLVNGKEEQHPEGAYYIEWRDAGKRIRLSVGKDAADAAAMRLRKETELNNGDGSVPPTNGTNGHRSVVSAIAAYLEEVKLRSKPKTYAAYNKALEFFQESCHKLHVEDVDRRDLLRFAAYLRDEQEHSARTVSNYFEHVMTFLKAQGVSKLVSKHDRPRYVEEEPEVYEKADLDKFLSVCDSRELALFKAFLMSGFREQEIMHLHWTDVDFSHGVLRMTHKPLWGWTPKAYKEREVPMPDALVAILKDWREKRTDKKCPLVFPNGGGCNPDGHFLRSCKVVAERAGLDPENFWLHKFRATFATWHLWAGVDLRTVQLWLGHSDLESTMRYLKPSRSEQVRAKVNATFAATAS